MAKKSEYIVVWNTEDACDGFDADNLIRAKQSVYDIYEGWLMYGMEDPDPDDWNGMILNCYAEVQKLNKETGKYEFYWTVSDDWLERTGWVEK